MGGVETRLWAGMEGYNARQYAQYCRKCAYPRKNDAKLCHICPTPCPSYSPEGDRTQNTPFCDECDGCGMVNVDKTANTPCPRCRPEGDRTQNTPFCDKCDGCGIVNEKTYYSTTEWVSAMQLRRDREAGY